MPRFKFFPDGWEGELVLEGTPEGVVSILEVKVEVIGKAQEKEKPPTHFVEMVVSEFVKKLGWVPSDLPPERVYVDEVETSSWASNAGLLVGDELTQVDGNGLGQMFFHGVLLVSFSVCL